MNKTNFNAIYDGKYRSKSADRLKFWLMPFVMFALFGFPTKYGSYVAIFSKFTAPAFFILSGFFILSPDGDVRRKKLKRAVKRSLIIFAAMFAVYFSFSAAYLSYVGYHWLPEIMRKRILFEFFTFNVWHMPIGSSIWFIHSLFYANVILLIADKLGFLKRAYVYLPTFILFFVFMLASGEFSKLAGFPYFGYRYLPVGAFTCALPYMLLGMIIRRHANLILNINRKVFPLLFTAGFFLAALELNLLAHYKLLIYYEHTVGFGVMAASVCCFALSKIDSRETFISAHGRNYARRIYYLCQPVRFIVILTAAFDAGKYYLLIRSFSSFIVFFICLFIAFLIGTIKYAIIQMKENDKR